MKYRLSDTQIKMTKNRGRDYKYSIKLLVSWKIGLSVKKNHFASNFLSVKNAKYGK